MLQTGAIRAKHTDESENGNKAKPREHADKIGWSYTGYT